MPISESLQKLLDKRRADLSTRGLLIGEEPPVLTEEDEAAIDRAVARIPYSTEGVSSRSLATPVNPKKYDKVKLDERSRVA